ncbi:c-type cytochrome [Nitrospira sp. Nam80]
MGSSVCAVGRSLCAFFLVLGVGILEASESSSEQSLQEGRQIFHTRCAGCHGLKGKGDGYRLLGPAPADLTSPRVQEKTDEDLLKSINHGKPNMPPWDVALTASERESILAYVRTLAE